MQASKHILSPKIGQSDVSAGRPGTMQVTQSGGSVALIARSSAQTRQGRYFGARGASAVHDFVEVHCAG